MVKSFGMAGIIESSLSEKLAAGLSPQRLEIVNDSARHAGHAGDNGSGESHFSVLVVSERFSGLGRVERQRLVHAVLAEELKGAVHALSLKALTPDEYERM